MTHPVTIILLPVNVTHTHGCARITHQRQITLRSLSHISVITNDCRRRVAAPEQTVPFPHWLSVSPSSWRLIECTGKPTITKPTVFSFGASSNPSLICTVRACGFLPADRKWGAMGATSTSANNEPAPREASLVHVRHCCNFLWSADPR